MKKKFPPMVFMNEQDDNDNPWQTSQSSSKDTPPSVSDNNPEPRKKASLKLHKPSENGDEKRTRSSRKPQQRSGNFLDDFVDKIQGKGSFMPPGGGAPLPSLNILGVILLIVIGMWGATGFFRVQEGELGAILRFGELVRVVNPGLQYRLPYPFEQEIVRKVAVLNKIDSGLKNEYKQQSNETYDQTLILTGDENMVHTNYTVLWKIRDLADFLFNSKDPEATITVAAESAIREILGQTTARLALTEGRETIGTNAQDLLQRILDMYKLGIQVVSVQLQRVEPPAQVIQAFNDMQASLVDADRLRNEAEAYRNDILPRARGEAERIIQSAEAYQQEVVAIAEGEVARFNAIYAAYKANPDVTMRRHYFETIQKLLQKMTKTLVDGKVAHNGLVPYMNLNPSLSLPAPNKGK